MKRIGLSILFALLSVVFLNANSKHERLVELAGKVHGFNSVFSQEKVFLFFDNTAYFQGETIWFKAFVTDASSFTQAQSRVLYVELVSPTGVVLQQKKLPVAYGQSHGDFVLKDVGTAQARDYRGVIDYPSGFYEIRAYTRNQLNFDRNAIFSRVFPVYTDPVAKGEFESSRVLEQEPTAIAKRPDPDKQNSLNVSFYPEGGTAIAGIPQRVAFKVTDKDGYNVDDCQIFDKDDNLLGSVSHDGMGSFTYLPPKGAFRVYAKSSSAGKTAMLTLPQPQKSGWTLSLEQPSSKQTSVKFNYAAESSIGMNLADTLGVAVTCRGNVIAYSDLNVLIETGKTAFETNLTMDASGWPLGVCQLVLYNAEGQILLTRMFFHSNPAFVTPSITVEKNQNYYDPFERVDLRFSLKDAKGNPIKDRFALSVRDAADYGNGSTDNILYNLLLCSDLKGYIRNPDYYFEKADARHLQDLDLLMLVQGWQRYDWNVMSGMQPFVETQRLEESLTLNGWVKTRVARKKLDGVTVSAGLTPKDKSKSARFSAVTDSSGYFGFNLPDFDETAKITLRLSSKKHKDLEARIVFDRGAVPDPRAYELAEKHLNGAYSSKKLSLNKNQLFDAIADTITGYILPEVDIIERRQFIDYDTFTAFDAQAEVEIELDRGERTDNVVDFLINKGYVVYDNDSSSSGSSDDLAKALAFSGSFFINGTPSFWYVHDSEKTRYVGKQYPPHHIPMELVKSVIVFDKPMPLNRANKFMPLLHEASVRQISDIQDILKFKGEDMSSGSQVYYVVDLQLKDQYEIKPSDYFNKLGKRVADVQGYSVIIDFYAPEYASEPMPGTADFRRTLYWNPNVITDENGQASVSFYNNSYSRNMVVTGAGITQTGTPYILNTDL